MMLVIAGHISVAAEVRSTMLDAVAPLVAKTRQEDGCVGYSLSADPVVPEHVVVLEIWASKDAVTTHMQTPTFAELGAITASFKPTGASLNKYRVDASAPLYGAGGAPSFDFD
jgi:quinol monooxygenase YgiN